MRRHAGGFTMLELVTIIIILGILAVVVMPRMDTSVFRILEFHDKTVAALRYAQKTATSHRRTVCVAITASTVTLTIALSKSGPCTQALNLPGSNLNVVEGDTTNAVVFSSYPATINFLPDGSGTDATLTISGQTPITIVGATGSVY